MIQVALASLVLVLTAAQDGEATPKKAAPDVPASVERATALLVELQETLESEGAKNEWPYEGVYREGRDIPVGYRVGGTAIGAWALIEAPRYAKSKEAREAVERAVEFVLAGLERPRMKSGFEAQYDVRGWGHTYALNLLLRLRAKGLVPQGKSKAVGEAIAKLVETLQQTEIVETGGWNYSRPKGAEQPAPASPFMTAPTLLALFEAREQGEKVDDAVVTRALYALERCRTEQGAIPYTTKGGRDE